MKAGKKLAIFAGEDSLVNMMVQGLFLGIGFSMSDVLFTILQKIFHFTIQ